MTFRVWLSIKQTLSTETKQNSSKPWCFHCSYNHRVWFGWNKPLIQLNVKIFWTYTVFPRCLFLLFLASLCYLALLSLLLQRLFSHVFVQMPNSSVNVLCDTSFVMHYPKHSLWETSTRCLFMWCSNGLVCFLPWVGHLICRCILAVCGQTRHWHHLFISSP